MTTAFCRLRLEMLEHRTCMAISVDSVALLSTAAETDYAVQLGPVYSLQSSQGQIASSPDRTERPPFCILTTSDQPAQRVDGMCLDDSIGQRAVIRRLEALTAFADSPYANFLLGMDFGLQALHFDDQLIFGNAGSDRLDTNVPRSSQSPRPTLSIVQQRMVPEGEPPGRVTTQVVTTAAAEIYGPIQPPRTLAVSAPVASAVTAMVTPTVGAGVLRSSPSASSIDRAMSVDMDWLARNKVNAALTTSTVAKSDSQTSPSVKIGFNERPNSWVEIQANHTASQPAGRTQWQDFGARPHLATLPQSDALDLALSGKNAHALPYRAGWTHRVSAVRDVGDAPAVATMPLIESLIKPAVIIARNFDPPVTIEPESADELASLSHSERSKPNRVSRYWYLAAIPAFFIFQRSKDREPSEFSLNKS